MKKLLLSVTLLSIVFVFYYCSKNKSDSSGRDNLVVSPLAEVKAVAADGGATCNCLPPGTASCSVSCLFSSCCICWDPKKETGSCGCYFGIALCKTAAIGATNPAKAAHNVKVYAKAFEQFLPTLKSFDRDALELVRAYHNMTEKSGKAKGDTLLIDHEHYEPFANAYREFVGSLSDQERSTIHQYLNDRKPK